MVGFSQIGPSGWLVKLTKAASDITVTRSLWVGTAGTANITDEQGNVITDFPLKEGLNPLRIKRLATGGTADDIWAMY
jgi:hypothetical protein